MLFARQEANLAIKTLYVSNFPYSVTASEIQVHFAAYNASNPRVIEGRGFCFIDVDEDQMAAAIADKNDKDFQGRRLTVNEAQPRGTSRGGDDSR
jgi:RNA recognition motif-containing protein